MTTTSKSNASSASATPKRGSSSGSLAPAPRQRQSGEPDPQLGITKSGDSYLRSLLVESANYILSSRCKETDLKRWGLAPLREGDANTRRRVKVALARKLAVLLHSLWLSGAVYQPGEKEAAIACLLSAATVRTLTPLPTRVTACLRQEQPPGRLRSKDCSTLLRKEPTLHPASADHECVWKHGHGHGSWRHYLWPPRWP